MEPARVVSLTVVATEPDDSFTVWALNRRQLSPKTLRDYQIWLRCATRWSRENNVVLSQASTEDLLTFVDSLKRTASLRNNVRSALIAYFDYVTTTGRRTDNPAKAILRWREPKRLPKPIERTQATRLIAQAFVYRPIFGCLVVLYLNTGLRLSELCQRRWSDLVGNRLFLVKKGGDERCVFLNSAAMQALNEWRAQCSSPLWMFPSPRSNERPISRHWVYDKIRDLGVIAGIDGCRPHRLRHTFGTELYRQTHDLLLVKEALGHEDVRNTVIYTRVAIGIQEALEKLHY